MARGTSHTDPFNAADPILPADYVEMPGGDEDAAASSRRHAHKAPDRYEAPVIDQPFRGGLSSLDDMSSPVVSGESPSAAASRPEGPSSLHRRLSVPAARRRGGCVKPLIALLIVACVAVPLAAALFEALVDVIDDAGRDDESYTVTTDIDEDAGRRQVASLVTGRLDTLATDERLLATVAEEFSQGCEDDTGFSAEQLGIDARAHAQWLLSAARFEMSSAYARDGYDGKSPTGSAYYDAWCYDASDFFYTLMDEVSEYLRAEGVSRYGEDALTQAQQDEVGRMYDEAAALAQADDVHFLGFEAVYEDGDWQLDEEYYYTQLSRLF